MALNSTNLKDLASILEPVLALKYVASTNPKNTYVKIKTYEALNQMMVQNLRNLIQLISGIMWTL